MKIKITALIFIICINIFGNNNFDEILNEYADMPGIEEIKSLLEEGINAQTKEELEINGISFDKGSTALMISIDLGYTDLSKALISDKEIKLSVKDSYGSDVLHYAAAKGNGEIINMLIKKKANVNSKNKLGLTPLVFALWYGNYECLTTLLENKANIRIKDNAGHTVMHYISENTDTNSINLLIAKGAKVDVAAKTCGETPLITAVISGNTPAVKILIENKANVNHKDKGKASALTYAAIYNYSDIADILIKNKADVNSKGRLGVTDLMYAAIKNSAEVINILIENKADINAHDDNRGDTALIWASEEDSAEAVKLLIEAGADINSKDKGGYTALIRAAKNNSINAVNILLENNADVNIENDENYSALMYAIIKDNYEIAKQLIKNGADREAKNKDGYNAYDLLKIYADDEDSLAYKEIKTMILGISEELEEMLEKYDLYIGIYEIKELLKTDINAATENSYMIETEGFYNNDSINIRLYENALSDVYTGYEGDEGEHIVIPKGYTPLMIASMFDYIDIVYELIKIGADVNFSTGEYKHTPLMIASYYGNYTVVDILISKDADINRVDTLGKTALDYAKEQGNEDIINMLTEAGAK